MINFNNDLDNIFGDRIDASKAKKIRGDIFFNFRKPMIKKDISTHGSLWNQYIHPVEIINVNDLNIDINLYGYIFFDKKDKNLHIYNSSLSKFIEYLESREDGLYSAVYFIDDNFTFCLGENGERGSMKPIYLYKGIRK